MLFRSQFLVVLKLVGLHLPPERNEISPHPWALCLWKPSSFSDWWARAEEAELAEKEEEVWTVEIMAMIRWRMTWSRQIGAWAEEEEAWIKTSPAHPSLVDPQLGRACRWEVSS